MMEKRRGAMTDPCGTPISIFFLGISTPFHLMTIYRSVRKERTKRYKLGEIPAGLRWYRSLVCQTESKAFDMSKKQENITFFLLRALRMCSA